MGGPVKQTAAFADILTAKSVRRGDGMPPDRASPSSIRPGPGTRDTTGREHRRAHIPQAEAQSKAWLPWRAHGRLRGLKAHRVAADGSIIEVHDPASEPRRRPKAVSSRQWREG